MTIQIPCRCNYTHTNIDDSGMVQIPPYNAAINAAIIQIALQFPAPLRQTKPPRNNYVSGVTVWLRGLEGTFTEQTLNGRKVRHRTPRISVGGGSTLVVSYRSKQQDRNFGGVFQQSQPQVCIRSWSGSLSMSFLPRATGSAQQLERRHGPWGRHRLISDQPIRRITVHL